MNVFRLGNLKLASGLESKWKIECDSFDDDDWATLAWLISERIKFSSVIGVPRGGLILAEMLEEYISEGPRLVVDDVFTTGKSIKSLMKEDDVGFVVFARNTPPDNIKYLFLLSSI